MTAIQVRKTPSILETKRAVTFKLFIPRELEHDPAFALWGALREVPDIVLADPFAAPGVSTVFPGTIYVDGAFNEEGALQIIADTIEPALDGFPDEFEDAWLECWVPDSYEDVTEAHDVQDLTQTS